MTTTGTGTSEVDYGMMMDAAELNGVGGGDRAMDPDDLHGRLDMDKLLRLDEGDLNGSGSMIRTKPPQDPWFVANFHVDPRPQPTLRSPVKVIEDVGGVANGGGGGGGKQRVSAEMEERKPSVWDSPQKVSDREKELLTMLDRVRGELQRKQEKVMAESPVGKLSSTMAKSRVGVSSSVNDKSLLMLGELRFGGSSSNKVRPASATNAKMAGGSSEKGPMDGVHNASPGSVNYRDLQIKDKHKLSKEERARLREEAKKPVAFDELSKKSDDATSLMASIEHNIQGLATGMEREDPLAGIEDEETRRDAMVLQSYESFLDLLRRQEKMLSMKRHLIDLENRRGPRPKWYMMKGADFSYELQKFNNVDRLTRPKSARPHSRTGNSLDALANSIQVIPVTPRASISKR
jgi:hypothetical protein